MKKNNRSNKVDTNPVKEKNPFVKAIQKSKRKVTQQLTREDIRIKRKDKRNRSLGKPKIETAKSTENKVEKGRELKSEMRLNRFIANAGVCSRRAADLLIEDSKITVNGKVVTEMGYKVKPGDTVVYNGKTLQTEKLIYLLLNKPKGFITTMSDPEERRTVLDLIGNACEERIYPVGRLDRMTTGLLLFTNDGEVAKKLSHPSHQVKKVYRVELDKEISDEDIEKIKAGVVLEDGKAEIDDVAVNEIDKIVVGIELHIGRNRIVRRIFEHLGYTVEKLDRTTYAGLTKLNLPRGKYRMLTQHEVTILKNMK